MCPPGCSSRPSFACCDETRAVARSSITNAEAVKCALGLVARERLLQLLREAQHRASIRLLPRIVGDVQLEQPDERVRRHSYWSASRMLSLDARLAGKIAARMPTKIAASAKMIRETTGSEKTMKSTL